jgi:hypothetical protein
VEREEKSEEREELTAEDAEGAEKKKEREREKDEERGRGAGIRGWRRRGTGRKLKKEENCQLLIVN